MKKNKEVQQLLRSIIRLDLIVGLVLGIVVYFVKSDYVFVCLLGFFLATINFFINSYITEYAIIVNRNNGKVLMVLGYFFRMFLVGIIGAVLFTHNKFNVIAYMLGYTFRFSSLILYGLSLKNKN
ncbi:MULTISPECIES: ATP synthase subunit I [Clostridium]|uniref:ATP synthase I chain n=2 Tax=Clostridium TaxID=1485 RepID=A0A151AP16_9CLOT|nr:MULTISPECIES: ATP synthase subunit I [Clostridium]KYH29384.1 ATP synthase I chain [Clostridium colicanis DSM 13634]PRR70834.1 ATP synthase I chain [Clostridium thermopalmarium DSM 5974]PVZ28758.1 ATP synthase protein I [Clostridium thermopalmarium DSM 5974]